MEHCVIWQVYQRLDQPITALNLFKQGLDHFPGEVTLLTGIARIHEVQYVHSHDITANIKQETIFTLPYMILFQEMNNISSATEYYKDVLKQDNTHVEAIACIGSNHFYTDQPEIALRFYRSVVVVFQDFGPFIQCIVTLHVMRRSSISHLSLSLC